MALQVCLTKKLVSKQLCLIKKFVSKQLNKMSAISNRGQMKLYTLVQLATRTINHYYGAAYRQILYLLIRGSVAFSAFELFFFFLARHVRLKSRQSRRANFLANEVLDFLSTKDLLDCVRFYMRAMFQ